MATNVNEPHPYDVVHATKWSKGGRGELKSRLVVLKYKPASNVARHGFAVRTQAGRGGDNAPTFGGATFPSQRAAHDAFLREYLRHNGYYGPGNISHYPGLRK